MKRLIGRVFIWIVIFVISSIFIYVLYAHDTYNGTEEIKMGKFTVTYLKRLEPPKESKNGLDLSQIIKNKTVTKVVWIEEYTETPGVCTLYQWYKSSPEKISSRIILCKD